MSGGRGASGLPEQGLPTMAGGESSAEEEGEKEASNCLVNVPVPYHGAQQTDDICRNNGDKPTNCLTDVLEYAF